MRFYMPGTRVVKEVSTLSVEQKYVSVSHNTFRAVAESHGIHQGLETGIEMGSPVGDIDFGLSRRPYSYREISCSNVIEYKEDDSKVDEFRLSSQSKEIPSTIIQHQEHDINRTVIQDTRYPSNRPEVTSPAFRETDSSNFVYRQGFSHLHSSIPARLHTRQLIQQANCL